MCSNTFQKSQYKYTVKIEKTTIPSEYLGSNMVCVVTNSDNSEGLKSAQVIERTDHFDCAFYSKESLVSGVFQIIPTG
jgi:hypothetical protein